MTSKELKEIRAKNNSILLEIKNMIDDAIVASPETTALRTLTLTHSQTICLRAVIVGNNPPLSNK